MSNSSLIEAGETEKAWNKVVRNKNSSSFARVSPGQMRFPYENDIKESFFVNLCVLGSRNLSGRNDSGSPQTFGSLLAA